MWITQHKKLRAKGILGLNERNVSYISRYNSRKYYPLVDNKLLTKRAAEEARISVPDLLGVIDSPYLLNKLPQMLDPLQEFVVKPARGSGGKGILVITGRAGENFVKPGGRVLTLGDVHHDISNILSGVYSLGGKPDSAFVEALVHGDPFLQKYSHQGLPDIRVIIFQGFPVMAMLRCPTKSSDGKANLHQGAVGVGIDIISGKALRAVQNNRIVSVHPDTGVDFSDLVIPNWRDLLRLASSCYDFTNLGYLGCDMVLDRTRGPLILEVNARPGLSIQTATGVGLRHRLRAIEALVGPNMNIDQRIDIIQTGIFD